MNKLFKMVLLTICMVFLTSSVWALTLEDHVKVAPGGKGDVLIFPFYAAIDGGWETKLTVINTHKQLSTVAKVVVRSPVWSQELLDFFIYLSPTDVWTGTLKFDAQMGAILESDSDSIVSRLGGAGNPVWGDEETARRALIAPTGVLDFNEMGYAYVINVASFELGPPQVDKDDIYDAYQQVLAAGDLGENLPENVLSGWMDFQVAGFGLTSALNAVTLRDYNNEEVAVIAEETILGAEANNTLMEVEAALSKNDIAIPYLNTGDDVSLHFLTFPTKYSVIGQDNFIAGVRSPFAGFDAERDFCVRFQLDLYDTTEDSITPADPIWSPAPPAEFNDFCLELNWLVSDESPFDEGWIRYTLNYTTTGLNELGEEITYTGAPIIPVGLNLGMSGMSLKYGAWTDGEVSSTAWDGAGFPVEGYQYADFGRVMMGAE